MKTFWLKVLITFCISSYAYALCPEKKLNNEKQEQRAMNLFLQVRCLVCNGQVIESSDTIFSFAMRKNIRQKISIGKSDEEIKKELAQEFGNDILTEPNKKTETLLWILPLIFALVGLIILLIKFAKK